MIALDPKHLCGLPPAALQRLCRKAEPFAVALFAHRDAPGAAFLDLPDDAALLRHIGAFVKAQQKHGWTDVVVLGIGGSALGLIAIRDALLPPFDQKPRLHAVDNIDPVYTAALFDFLDFKKTLFIVISKSGETAEPMLLYGLARQRLKKMVKNWQQHFVFVTDRERGLLRRMADKEGIAAFDVPDKVGGRFSVLSAVGLLPAALAGADIGGLLRGARAMRERIRKTGGADNPALALAASQHFFDIKKGKPMTVMMPYGGQLYRFADWYQQLLAESIGKSRRAGPTPIRALGTTDQHSQLQLFADGPDNKWFIFLRAQRFAADVKLPAGTLPKEIGFLNGKKMSDVMNASCRGTAAALAEKDRPSLTLVLEKIDAEHLGQLFMLFECQVALLGKLYGVNAFNQPGVEAGKTLTRQLLSA